MRHTVAGGWALVALALAACDRQASRAAAGVPTALLAPTIPQAQLARAATAAAPLLAMAPAGAELAVEVDLRRLRDNPVVGPLYAAMTDTSAGPAPLGLDYDVVRKADLVAVFGYDIGTAEARALTLLQGEAVPDPGDTGVRIDARTVALAPPELLIRFEAARAGQSGTLDRDETFMRLRDAAMPEKAEHAALRITADLSFEARLGLGRLLGLDAVPVAASVWGDVVDDLAVVALLSGDDETTGQDLADALAAWRDRLRAEPWVRERRLSSLARDLVVEESGDLARAIFIVGPRTLERAVGRLMDRFAVR